MKVAKIERFIIVVVCIVFNIANLINVKNQNLKTRQHIKLIKNQNDSTRKEVNHFWKEHYQKYALIHKDDACIHVLKQIEKCDQKGCKK